MPRVLPLLLAKLATLSMALAAADMMILTQIPTIAMARMDPIVNPGEVSSHVHNVLGASNFGLNILSPDDQIKASCTSAIVHDDKSNYWAPALYWQFPNGTYQPMIGGNRIYYFMKGNKPIKPFPPGFRMISGTAMARNATAYQSKGVRISCNHGPGSSELPTQACRAISMGIFFPSCGLADGSIKSDDNFSHMAWPLSFIGATPYDDPNGETCPDSHPIKYPTIFFEANYYPVGGQKWTEGSRYVLSNGDAWGPSYHADFLNGWVPSVLDATVKQCGGTGKGPGQDQAKCKPLAPSVNKDTTVECRLEGKIPNEDLGMYRPIKQLPGCNPRWDKGVDKKPGCSIPRPAPEMVYPNVYLRSLEFNAHTPFVFTDAPVDTNFSDIEGIKYGFVPSLGAIKKSYLVPWGTDGTNQADLKVSSIKQLLQAGGDNSNLIAVKPASSKSSSSAKAATSSAKSSLQRYEPAKANADDKAVTSSSSTSEHTSSSSTNQHATTNAKSTSAVAAKAVATVSEKPSILPGNRGVLVAENVTKTCKSKKRSVPNAHLERRSRRSALSH